MAARPPARASRPLRPDSALRQRQSGSFPPWRSILAADLHAVLAHDARVAAERRNDGRHRPVEEEVVARAEDDVARIAVLREPDVALHDRDAPAVAVAHAQRLAGVDLDAGCNWAEVHGVLLDTCFTCIYVERHIAVGQTEFPTTMDAL